MRFDRQHLLIYWILVSMSPLMGWGQPTGSEKVFLWDQGESEMGFWRKSINCGRPNQPGGRNNAKGSKVTFGSEKHVRFPGAKSVELFTDASFEERCNQNFSAERAEIEAQAAYRNLGIEPGSTVWIGWSELYTSIDRSHTTTLMQFRSNCGSGSPAVALRLLKGGNLTIRRSPKGESVRKILTLEENTWYDWVMEFTYSKEHTGKICLWVYEVGSPGELSFNRPTVEILGQPTMFQEDNCPHIRWGVYRWESGDKKPPEIKNEDRSFVKYLGPVRIRVGDDLGINGFNAVRPRP